MSAKLVVGNWKMNGSAESNRSLIQSVVKNSAAAGAVVCPPLVFLSQVKELLQGSGIFLGAQIPASWSLDFAGTLTFIALLFPTLKDRASVGAALAGGLAAILAYGLPLRLGLVAASLVGIAVGVLIEVRLWKSG